MYRAKIFVALIALAMFTLTAGCGKQEQPSTKKEETKSTTELVKKENMETAAGGKTQTLDQWQALSEERQADWESMSEEEKQALREKRKAVWESLSEEEKQALREERQAKWDSMSEEEQQALREKGIQMKSRK